MSLISTYPPAHPPTFDPGGIDVIQQGLQLLPLSVAHVGAQQLVAGRLREGGVG